MTDSPEAIKRTLDTFTGLIEPAIAKDAKIAVLIDFGNLRVASYLNCGDHPKEKARFLEKFSREERKRV